MIVRVIVRRRIVALTVGGAFLLSAGVAIASDGSGTVISTPPPDPTPSPQPTPPPADLSSPPVVPPAPRHPAQITGWVRPLHAGLHLRDEPSPTARVISAVTTALIAGRLAEVRRGGDGAIWVRVEMPQGPVGWALGSQVRLAPAPQQIALHTRVVIERSRAALGPRSAVLVRDAQGRTLFSTGTPRPLVLASVTKLGTMAAALERFPVDRSTAYAVLGRSDNYRAQLLSNRLGGTPRLGAQRTRQILSGMGVRMNLVDGSGLGRSNRASALDVSNLLLTVRERPWFSVFNHGLAVSGRSGTLSRRMTRGSARARVRAKTGTLTSIPVSTLAGYVSPHGRGVRSDQALVVVILGNSLAAWRARRHQDSIMQALTAPGALTSGTVELPQPTQRVHR